VDIFTIAISQCINFIIGMWAIETRKKIIKDASFAANAIILVLTFFLPIIGILLLIYYYLKLFFGKKPLSENETITAQCSSLEASNPNEIN